MNNKGFAITTVLYGTFLLFLLLLLLMLKILSNYKLTISGSEYKYNFSSIEKKLEPIKTPRKGSFFGKVSDYFVSLNINENGTSYFKVFLLQIKERNT